jgi:DNA/RNA endonuclease G (NUC1)
MDNDRSSLQKRTGIWGNRLLTVAFVMDQNTPRNSPLRSHVKTVRQVEQLTGLNFFWELPASVESGAETGTSKGLLDFILK